MDYAEWEDLNKRHGGCSFVATSKINGKPRVLHCSAIRHHEYPHFDVIASGRTYTSFDWDFDFSFPESGLYNADTTIINVMRQPKRQWKKSMCSENTMVYNPLANLFFGGIGQLENLVGNSPQYAKEDIFFPVYYTLPAAISTVLNRERIATAVNKSFFISPSHYNKNILLWYHDILVAELLLENFSNKIQVVETAKAMNQEVIDFLRENTNA